MFFSKIYWFMKKLSRFFFEEKLKKSTNQENFYEHNMDKNYMKNLIDDKQLVNQRILYLLLFLNNLIFEILICISFKNTETENYLNSLLGINIFSFILLLIFLFSLKRNFIRSNFYNCFMIFQFDIIFIYCFIWKFLVLELDHELTFYNYYKILLLNFFLTLTLNILFFRSVIINIGELVCLIIYKILLFISFIYCGKSKINKFMYNLEFMKIQNFNLTSEIYNIIFYAIICFYFILRKNFFFEEVKTIINFKSEKCNYYQSLLNILNKSFLSFNKSSFRVNCNNSFINFLRKLGLNDLEINYALDFRDIQEFNRVQEKKKALYENKIKEIDKAQTNNLEINLSNDRNKNLDKNNKNVNLIKLNNGEKIENSTGDNKFYNNKIIEDLIKNSITSPNLLEKSNILKKADFQAKKPTLKNTKINENCFNSNISKKKNFSSFDLIPVKIFEENDLNIPIKSKGSIILNHKKSLINQLKKHTIKQDKYTKVNDENTNNFKSNEDNFIYKKVANESTNTNLNNFTNFIRNNFNIISDNIINNSTKNNLIQNENYHNFKLADLNNENPTINLNLINNGKCNQDNIINKKNSIHSSNHKKAHLENLFINTCSMMNIKENSDNNFPSKMFNNNKDNQIQKNNINDISDLASNPQEDLFLFKLDYLLNKIFDNFIESSNFFISLPNINKGSIGSCQKSSLSDYIRDIFYEKEFIDLDENFNFRGIFYCDLKALRRKINLKRENLEDDYIINLKENQDNYDKNSSINISKIDQEKEIISIEVYSRKILMPEGELIEFYFNDITSVSKVEKGKAENKIKSLVLAKISHEFKTPLITIIYILKNYISKEKAENSDKLQRQNYSESLKSIKNENKDMLCSKTSSKEINLTSNRKYDKAILNLNNNEISFHENKKELKKKNSINTQEKYINNIIDLSDYMLSLINDVIDFSVVDSNYEMNFQLDFFDLHKMLNFGFRIMKILINCKGLGKFIEPIIDIDENVPQLFFSDEMRIKQVLLNLISNSIKFTRRGYIKIIAKLINLGTVEISIEDTGIGISAEDMKKLFIDFGKLKNEDSAKMNKLGSGLGLSICKKIIAKLGTEIQVESQQNTKTRFYFGITNKNLTMNSNRLMSSKSLMNVHPINIKGLKNYKLKSIKTYDNNKRSLNVKNNHINLNNEDIPLAINKKISINTHENINLKKLCPPKNMNFRDDVIKKNLRRKSTNNIKPRKNNASPNVSQIETYQDISSFNYHTNRRRRFSQFSYISDNQKMKLKDNIYLEEDSEYYSNLFHSERNGQLEIIKKKSNDACYILGKNYKNSFEDGLNDIFLSIKPIRILLKNFFKITNNLESGEISILNMSDRSNNNDVWRFAKLKKSLSMNCTIDFLNNNISSINKIGNLTKRMCKVNKGNNNIKLIDKSFQNNFFSFKKSDNDSLYNQSFLNNKLNDELNSIKQQNLIYDINQTKLDTGIKLYKNYTTKEKKINTSILNKFQILGEGRNGNFLNINKKNAFDGESSFSNSRNSNKNVIDYIKNNLDENLKFDKAYNIEVTNDSQTFNNGSENEDTIMKSPKEIFYIDLKNDKIITEKKISDYILKDLPYSANLNNLKNNEKDVIKRQSSFSMRSEHSKNTKRDNQLIKININNNFNNFNDFNRNSLKPFEIEKTANFCILSSSFFTNIRGEGSELELFLLPIKKYFKKMMKFEKMILIVDDNEIIRHSIKRVIKSINKSEQKENISVICLGDGIELIYMIMIDQTMKNFIKLIICDEQMIYLNGSDCFRIIKDLVLEKKINKIPFVFCSSSTECISQFNYRDNSDINPNEIDYTFLKKPPSKPQIKSIFEMFNI